MPSIYSIIDQAQYGMLVENSKVYAATQNIVNASNPNYVPKAAQFDSLILGSSDFDRSNMPLSGQDVAEFIVNKPGKNISLDSEVVAASDAGLRYQVMADLIQKKFGLLELIYGVKK